MSKQGLISPFQYHDTDHLRLPRQPEDLARVEADSDLYGDLFERPRQRDQTRQSSSSSSDAVPVFLPFPGNEKSYKRPPRQAVQQGKYFTRAHTGKIDFSRLLNILFAVPTFTVNSGEPYTMPLQKLGGKEYYIGIFFKVRTISLSLNFIFPYSSSSSQANWYKAEQFCRFHNMHLASINSEQEQRELEVMNIFLD